MPNDMFDLFLQAVESIQEKSFFDNFDNRVLVSALQKRAKDELKLKQSTAPGLEGAGDRALQRVLIDRRMMMLLPFCQIISKYQDTDSLNFDSGAVKKTKKKIEKQLKKDSKDLDSHSALIACLALFGKFKDAEKEISELTSNNANYGLGWYMHGALQWRLDRLNEANLALEKAAALLPEEKMISISMAMISMNLRSRRSKEDVLK